MDTSLFANIRQDTAGLIGDVVEFGTYHARSTTILAHLMPERHIFTIDHFQGLEASKKRLPILPDGMTDWQEGMFKTNIEIAREILRPFSNVTIIDCDVHKLLTPAAYGIGQIAMAHIDTDIYEPAVSSLKFLSACKWNRVFIRFDDWHGGDPEYDVHERLAFREWIEANNYRFELTCDASFGEAYVSRKQ